MAKIDRLSAWGIFWTFFLTLIPVVVIIIVNNFTIERWFFVGLLVVVLASICFIELLSQEIQQESKKESGIVFHLVIKGIVISIMISIISTLLVINILIVIYGDDVMTKGIFNSLIMFSFFTTLFFYWLYMKLDIPKKMENVAKRLKKGREPINPTSNNKIYTYAVIEKMDLLAIIATVFLLSNSTYSTILPSENTIKGNPYDSLEFNLLFLLIPLYVQSAYYKLIKKQN